MSKYVTDAKAEADAYAKKRKNEALEVIEQINAAAAAEKEAASATAGEKMRDERRDALDTLDTAAVERQVTMQNIRQAMAGFGLTDSGTERAQLKGATRFAARKSTVARNKRDAAVSALKSALDDKVQSIERERLSDVTAEKQKADEDAKKNRTKLLEAAYAAEAKEEAARIKAEAAEAAAKEKAEAQERQDAIDYQKQVLKWKREDAEKIEKEKAKQEKEAAKEKEKQEKESAKAEDKVDKKAEEDRRKGLSALYKNKNISGEVYAKALEDGLTARQALSLQADYDKYNKAIQHAEVLYDSQDFGTVMATVAPYDLPEEFQRRLAKVLGVEYKRVHDWLLGYQNLKHSSDKVKEMDDLW